MKFSLGSLFSSRKNNDFDNQLEDIINDFEETPFAVSESNAMYAGFGELGGYHFIQTIIIGSLAVKTFNGARLDIVMNDFELNLNSDSNELRSEHSHISGRNITRIDFQIEESDIKKIESSRPEKVILSSDRKRIEFNIYDKDAS